MATMEMPFLVREKEALKVLSMNSSGDPGDLEKQEARVTLPTPKAAQWSPDGRAIALADPALGVVVQELTESAKVFESFKLLAGSSKTTQSLFWSPLGSHLVTISPAAKGNTEPNVLIFTKMEGAWSLSASFLYPRLERDKQIFQWSSDEGFCARLCPDGNVLILDGAQLEEESSWKKLDHDGRTVQNLEFAPLVADASVKARLAVFVPDVRDNMQRPVKEAEVTIWDLSSATPVLECKQLVSSGQISDLKWNSHGTALLAHCQTEVDETGASYYGGSKLILVSHDGKYHKDLTEDVSVVQAVSWSPTRNEFILINGYQPAKGTLWSWDDEERKAAPVKVLFDKAHRNTIRFNHFGSLVCIAGFGNLVGDIDFFRRLDDEKCDYVRVSDCRADCTVSAEWSPDGRSFLTAVLAPRMRVDNGVSVWRALTGTKVSQIKFEELFDVQWRPEAAAERCRFSDITTGETEAASKELANRAATQTEPKKKQAYRPPGARGGGGGSVAAMMRGEMGNDAPPQPKHRNRHRSEDAPTIGPGPAAVETPEEHEAPAPPPAPTATASTAAAAEPPASRAEHPARASASTSTPAVGAQPGAGYPGPKAAAPAKAAQPAPPAKVAQEPERRKAREPPAPAPQQPAAIQQSQQSAYVPLQTQQVHHTATGHGEKRPCPNTGWQYVDPRQNIQGPFTLLEMQQWHSMGYFRPDLPMRCDPGDRFLPFKDLFPHPLVPFKAYPRRPT
mmetsp:Transcript_937/g.1630  ORF Transcript_937/g.1630 Transcript_937/m.1630 type:complete len:733 (+) Transcript_937:368-2566(+)